MELTSRTYVFQSTEPATGSFFRMHDGLKKWDQALKPDPILSILYFKILFFLFIGSSFL